MASVRFHLNFIIAGILLNRFRFHNLIKDVNCDRKILATLILSINLRHVLNPISEQSGKADESSPLVVYFKLTDD